MAAAPAPMANRRRPPLIEIGRCLERCPPLRLIVSAAPAGSAAASSLIVAQGESPVEADEGTNHALVGGEDLQVAAMGEGDVEGPRVRDGQIECLTASVSEGTSSMCIERNSARA